MDITVWVWVCVCGGVATRRSTSRRTVPYLPKRGDSCLSFPPQRRTPRARLGLSWIPFPRRRIIASLCCVRRRSQRQLFLVILELLGISEEVLVVLLRVVPRLGRRVDDAHRLARLGHHSRRDLALSLALCPDGRCVLRFLAWVGVCGNMRIGTESVQEGFVREHRRLEPQPQCLGMPIPPADGPVRWARRRAASVAHARVDDPGKPVVAALRLPESAQADHRHLIVFRVAAAAGVRLVRLVELPE
mmetsp:Transcript_25974/g.56109  ORF Transcript_25974/g.56109 Transcript_25974/m.56109 type:complete len:246 (+) Transcript_25974:114-851(+)